MIFGDPFYFQDGPFAKPSLWVSAQRPAGTSPARGGDVPLAIVDDVGWAALALAWRGCCYLAFSSAWPRTSGAARLVVFLPFYVYALYAGQRAAARDPGERQPV